MQTEIKNKWIYEQTPDEVWKYLTQAELIALWLMPNNFEPVLGHEFEFSTKPISNMGLDGVFYCKILEMIPLKKLTYSWKGGPGNGVFTLDTIVEWTLEKFGNGTKLFLKQWGFKEANLAIFNAMTNGWQTNIQKMVNHLNTTNHDNTNA